MGWGREGCKASEGKKNPKRTSLKGAHCFIRKKDGLYTIHNGPRSSRREVVVTTAHTGRDKCANPRPREKSVINAPTAPMAAVEDIDKE